MVDKSCVFCRIIAGEETVSIVHEDDHTVAFMDISPLSPGHTLVVTREHHPTVLDLPEALAAHCMVVVRRITAGVKTATHAPAVNIFSANGRAGGQDVDHFHFHIIPVREGEDFPLQLPAHDGPLQSRSQLDVMAARIGRAIQEEAAV